MFIKLTCAPDNPPLPGAPPRDPRCLWVSAGDVIAVAETGGRGTARAYVHLRGSVHLTFLVCETVEEVLELVFQAERSEKHERLGEALAVSEAALERVGGRPPVNGVRR